MFRCQSITSIELSEGEQRRHREEDQLWRTSFWVLHWIIRKTDQKQLYFWHEHPWTARSWNKPKMRTLLEMPGVFKVKGDMDESGMIQEDNKGVAKISKTTGFATHAPEWAEVLFRTCSGQRRDIHFNGGHATTAGIYPSSLRKTIIAGFVSEMEKDGKSRKDVSAQLWR